MESHPNAFSPHWDVEQDQGPYRWRRARLARQAGSRDLGASLFDVPPGGEFFPMHAHYANEELAIVLSGRAALRTPEGTSTIGTGDVIAFPAGPAGAHHVRNDGDEALRILFVSTMRAPDVNLFPETGEVWARSYAPGSDAPAGALDVRFTPPASEVAERS